MRALCDGCVARGVSIGAHIGYRDKTGFGRRALPVEVASVAEDAALQILALQECAVAAGGHVAYVKPHGALYHRATVDAECAAAIVSAMTTVGFRLAALAFPGSLLIAQAHAAGLDAFREAFADRRYTPEGSLVERGEPGALLDPDNAVSQALSIARDGTARTTGGHRIEIDAASLCVHGDARDAAKVARRIRDVLEGADIAVRAFA